MHEKTKRSIQNKLKKLAALEELRKTVEEMITNKTLGGNGRHAFLKDIGDEIYKLKVELPRELWDKNSK